MTRPLDGILVVSLEQAVAAPYCTRQLAEMGARVIKVERPDGGDFARSYDTRARGESSHFVWANRSKESLALDLKDAANLDKLKALISAADVFVQNLAPGATGRLGLDDATLRARHPKLITCNISGYGRGGPFADRKAYDLLIQAEAGFLSVTGTPDQIAKAGISVADIAAATAAVQGILAALLRRERAGTGDHVEVSMLEAMADWMGYPMYYATDGAAPPPRAGAGHSTIYPYGPYPTSDGTVLFGLQNTREWKNFAHIVLERPAMAEDPRFESNASRAENRADIEPAIRDALSTLTTAEVLERLENAGIGTAQVNDMAGLWAHPQLRARDRWTEVDTPAGPIAALRPLSGEGWQPKIDAVPSLGQHTDSILQEIARLQDKSDRE